MFFGAGVYLINSQGRFTDTEILVNTLKTTNGACYSQGCGLYLNNTQMDISQSNINNNYMDISNPNIYYLKGAGISAENNSDFKILNSEISNNHIKSVISAIPGFASMELEIGGGGIYSNISKMTLFGSELRGNCIELYEGEMIDDFYNEYVYGAGFYVTNLSHSYISNCNVIDNKINNLVPSINTASGGIYCQNDSTTIINSIFWNNLNNNRIDNYSIANSITKFNYCAVQDTTQNTLPGIGNILLDSLNSGTNDTLNYPSFKDPENGDYSLLSTSDLLNKGTPTGSEYGDPYLSLENGSLVLHLSESLIDTLPNKCINGDSRYLQNRIDIGAYEGNAPVIKLPIYSEYLFEESEGTTVFDSNNSNDGIIMDTVKRVAGVHGGGLEFTGSGYISLGESFSENVIDEVTLSAWIKPDSTGGYQGIIMHGGPNIDTYAMYINPNQKEVAFKTTGTTNEWLNITNLDALWDGRWHLLTMTYDGSHKVVYLDKDTIKSIEATGQINSGAGYNLLIGAGRDQAIPILLYEGLIDEVRIYNYVVSIDSIPYYPAPKNLSITDYGLATWEPPVNTDGLNLTGYNVYLSGFITNKSGVYEYLKEFISYTNEEQYPMYYKLNLKQSYTIHVSAIYDEGESILLEKTFIYDPFFDFSVSTPMQAPAAVIFDGYKDPGIAGNWIEWRIDNIFPWFSTVDNINIEKPGIYSVTGLFSGAATYDIITKDDYLKVYPGIHSVNNGLFHELDKTAYQLATPVAMYEDGEIISLSIYHDAGSGDFILGVYEDLNGAPGKLIGVTPITDVSNEEGWQTVELKRPLTLNGGQKIWLSWVFENNPGIRFSTTSSEGTAISSASWTGSMAEKFITASFADNFTYSIYYTYRHHTPDEMLSISTDTINLDNKIGSVDSFNVSSIAEWSIPSIPDWLSISLQNGIESDSVQITATSNNADSVPRIAYLRVKGPETCVKILTVIQSSGFKDLSPTYSEYLFEESEGLIVYDSEGSNHGIIKNTALRVDGIRGGGLEFTGSGYVSLGESFSENVSDEVTLSAWIKPDPTGGYKGIIMHGGPNIDTYAMYINPNQKEVAFKTTGTTNEWLNITNLDALWDGRWHLLTMTYDGSHKVIYLDNDTIKSIEATGQINSGAGYNLLIGAGRDQDTPILLYEGLIDEVRIYNYALTNNDVIDLYNLIGIPVISSLVERDDAIQIYPNPNKGQFKVTWQNSYETGLLFKVYDMKGQLLRSEKTGAELREIELNLMSEPRGLYLIEIIDINNGDLISRTKVSIL